jgi:hypothetical protein
MALRRGGHLRPQPALFSEYQGSSQEDGAIFGLPM